MSGEHCQTALVSALVIVPSGVNYAYEVHGRRIAEALRALGFDVDLCDLSSVSRRGYDCCFLTNITEIIVSYCRAVPAGTRTGFEKARRNSTSDASPISPEQGKAALDAIQRLRTHCRRVVCCPIECTGTHWYTAIQNYCRATGVDTILDCGLIDQSASLTGPDRAMYYFLLNGLTPHERVAAIATQTEDRPIPWSFVGHRTHQRAALIDRLVNEVDPCGFVYVPRLSPNPGKGSPHLNEAQYAAVLRRCRYQVWCAHHAHFYMEVERFRMSLLAGCVPIKVVASSEPVPADAVFRSYVVSEAELGARLRNADFGAERRRFCEDFCQLPTLTESLATFLFRHGIEPRGSAAPRRRAA